MLSGRLDPGRLDCGDHARVQTRRFGQAGSDDPLRWFRRERRTGRDYEARATRALVLASLVERTDVAEEASEDGLMQVVVFRGQLVRAQLQLRHDLRELPLQLLPFAHADERQEVLAAPL